MLTSMTQASRSRGPRLSRALWAEPGVMAWAHRGEGLRRASPAGSMCRAPGKLPEEPREGEWGLVTTSRRHFCTDVHSLIPQLLEEGAALLVFPCHRRGI